MKPSAYSVGHVCASHFHIIFAMRSLCILALFCLMGWSDSQKCPARYLRFTPQHSFCLSSNPSCHIKRKGVSLDDQELILKLHNQFRSKIAMGNEHRSIGGSLPQAADMIQMEWDDELAAVAQKWTENCRWGHDCKECRAVEKFFVGQNLAMQEYTSCYECQEPSGQPDWTWAIKVLKDEVVDYRVAWLDSFTRHPRVKTGHLTQIMWSRSWRVGCGYSFYKKNGGFHRYYACNYGPGGNIQGEPVYKQGRPCSACPTNTQCSTRSYFGLAGIFLNSNNFPGLCKMRNPNTAPTYPKKQDGLLLNCGVSSSDYECQAQISGDGAWKTVRSVGGDYDSIILNGGQSSTVTFNTPIRPRSGAFCLALNFRKGPCDASKRDDSSLKAYFKMDHARAPPMDLFPQTTSFIGYNINLRWGMKTKLVFTFSVPKGVGQHVLDIRKIEAYDGSCDSRRD